MEKNNIIKSLSRVIANISLHKLIVIHTNRPESRHFLESEIIEYNSLANVKSQKFNWNDLDKEKIKEYSLKIIHNIQKSQYLDINFSNEETEKVVSDTIRDLLG